MMVIFWFNLGHVMFPDTDGHEAREYGRLHVLMQENTAPVTLTNAQ